MLTTSDAELLRNYARTGSEAAFTEIVHRYANLVYSAARRQTDDAEEARNLAQMVFADLARKAISIPARSLLAGWLCRGVRLRALEWRRNYQRRRRRERLAMDSLDNSVERERDGEWASVRPLLDDAIARLPDKDRAALLLRFFNNENLLTVGVRLGLSEDAAQKRVSRALIKLRALLAQRGITTTEAALSATLAANAVELAPSGAGSIWVSMALAGARSSSSNLLTLSHMKATLGIAAVAASLLVLTILQVRELHELRASLKSQAAELAVARAGIEQLNSRPLPAVDDSQVRNIARLRARIEQLRNEVEIAKNREIRAAQPVGPVSRSTDHRPASPQLTIGIQCLTTPVSSFTAGETLMLGAAQASSLAEALTNSPEVNSFSMPKVTTLCGRRAHISSGNGVENGAVDIGLAFDVIPECTTNSGMIDLQIFVSGTRLTAQSAIEAITNNANLTVPDGSTSLLVISLPENGPWFAGDPTNSDTSRQLLVLLTPTMIDPAGNRLHPIDTNDLPQSITANPSDVSPPRYLLPPREFPAP